MSTEITTADHAHMAHALRLAAHGMYSTRPNPRVGCVLVRDGVVVGEGWHVRAGEAHAEVHALHAAGDRARGATAYVTLEPCSHQGRTPPCSQALIAAGVTRVVAAMTDPNPRVAGQGLAQLRAAGITTHAGVGEDAAQALNPGFIQRMRTGRPYLRLKIATSLDGRTAMASGESRWITGVAARQDVQRLRARSCAILTGIGTVLADDPQLTVRWHEWAEIDPATPAHPAAHQPLRVVLDSHLRLPHPSRLLLEPGHTLVFTAASEHAGDFPPRTEVLTQPPRDIKAVLRELARREVNEVLVEAGARLNGALLAAGLVDEVVMYLAPHLMGDAARGAVHLPGLDTLAQRLRLHINEVRAVGEDWRITARVLGRD